MTPDGGPTPGPIRTPLFPLALVLYPGARLPLHIFEPRYRAMLADVLAATGRFGIVLRAEPDERAIAPGQVGCFAHVRDATPVGDGRSNILVDGGERVAVERLVDAGTPYFVAEVRPFADTPVSDPDALADAAARTRAAFGRLARAARTLADEPADPAAVASLALPEDDAQVAFAAAAAVDLPLAVRQRVLASNDAVDRTGYLAGLLERAVPALEGRAKVHDGARSNGRGPH